MNIIDQEKIHNALLNFEDGKYFIINKRYCCAFDKQYANRGFSPFKANENCESRNTAYANVAAYDMQDQVKLCGQIELAIDNDRVNKYHAMLFIKQYGHSEWQYSITITSMNIIEDK